MSFWVSLENFFDEAGCNLNGCQYRISSSYVIGFNVLAATKANVQWPQAHNSVWCCSSRSLGFSGWAQFHRCASLKLKYKHSSNLVANLRTTLYNIYRYSLELFVPACTFNSTHWHQWEALQRIACKAANSSANIRTDVAHKRLSLAIAYFKRHLQWLSPCAIATRRSTLS